MNIPVRELTVEPMRYLCSKMNSKFAYEMHAIIFHRTAFAGRLVVPTEKGCSIGVGMATASALVSGREHKERLTGLLMTGLARAQAPEERRVLHARLEVGRDFLEAGTTSQHP